MTSTPETTDNPRTADIPFNSLTNTTRQLCKGQHIPKERYLCKAVEATEEEEAGATEAERAIKISTNSTGKIMNISIETIRDIHP